MSYNAPVLAKPLVPLGLEKAIESIREDLQANLIWLTFSFGRAFSFREKDAVGKVLKIPKAYTGKGEYINVLPNDTLFKKNTAFTVFFQLRGEESYTQFNYQNGSTKEATVGIIFWGNLKITDKTKSYIFTEELKADVEAVIKTNFYVNQIDSWVDEVAEDVFDKYTIAEDSQYLMYPYSGFRVNVQVYYPEACEDLQLINYDDYMAQNVEDIDFRVGQDDGSVTFSGAWPVGGDTTFTIPALIGKKIRFLRGHVKQTKIPNDEGFSYTFNPNTGTVGATPALFDNELISIEIIQSQKCC